MPNGQRGKVPNGIGDMKTTLVMRCPDCGEKFRWPGEDELPNYCPLCSAWVGSDDPDFVPTKMNIGTIKGKAPDITYRQMEEASIARAEASGNPADKMTNMRDNLREVDVAAMPVNNIVTQTAEALAGGNYFQAAGMGDVAGALAGAKQGRERTTGSMALRAIQGGRASPLPTSVQGSFGGGFK